MRKLSIQAFQFVSDWRACDFRLRFWKKWRALFKAKHDGSHHPCGYSVRLSWDGVRCVNEGRETAHAKDHLWFELAIEGPTERQAFTEAPNETENCRRKRRW